MSIDDRLHGLAAQYIASPQWVKTVVGGVYSAVPRAFRHGSAYTRFKRVFDTSRADDSYVRERLTQTLTAALASVPAYRSFAGLLHELPDDPFAALRRFPLTEKEQIKRNLDDYLSGALPASARLRMFTGGSTAVPMTFYIQRGVSRAKELAAFDAMADRLGTDGSGVVLALRGRSVPKAADGRLWMYEPIKRHLILSSDHLEPRFMPAYVTALRRWRPRYVHAYPSALFPLVVWLRDNGLEDVLSGVRCVTLTSESVFSHHMEAFKSFFDCPVIVHYGHTERVLLATTLPHDPRYHFWPHYGHFELVDPKGQPVTVPGQLGEIVGTSFDNLVMPFVRYRTGDYAVLGGAPDASMPGCPVVERIEGRLHEFVVCADRRLITVTTIGAAHVEELEQCIRIQYEQAEAGRLALRVVPLHPLSDETRRRICAAIEKKTQGGCRVELEVVESIELTSRGKQRLLVQHLDVSSYLGAAMDGAWRDASAARADVSEGGRVPAAHADHRPLRCDLPPGRRLLMIGTSGKTQGGISTVVNTYRDGGLFEAVNACYVETHADGTRWDKALKFVRAFAVVARMLVMRRVALLHAHVSSDASFWRKSMVLFVARCFGVPTVFHLHSGGFSKWVDRRGRASLHNRWIRRTLESSGAIIVLNRGIADWMKAFAPQANVLVIGNPVIIPPIIGSREGVGEGRAGRVLYLGGIYDFKGCYDLLKAWAAFRELVPGWRLVVGGKGEIERFFHEAEGLGVRGDIEFLGWITGPTKERELLRADVLVLPSYHEGMPMSVLEAMAYGVPVIATPVGGVVDMMEPEQHGLWVSPGDVPALTRSLVRLAESASLRATLGAAAREHVIRNNGIDAGLGQLFRLYGDLLRLSDKRAGGADR